MSLALAMAAGLGTAQAGVLRFQDVVFTTTWSNNVLTLDIDAAKHSGDWSRATSLGALSLKDIGSFSSVSVTAAPKGATAWSLSSKELNAQGCAGGGGSRTSTALCISGTPIALTDNMVFTFTFTGGTPDLDAPHLKVSFLDASKNKVGDLLSRQIPAAPVVVVQPVTPVTPVTPATPVAPTPVAPVIVPAPAAPTPAAPATPAPVASTPVSESGTPASLPASGNTTVGQPETVVVTAPAVEPVTTPAIPVPPPVLVTQPELVLEPVSQEQGSNEVPEPQSIALLLGGLALMGAALRKRG